MTKKTEQEKLLIQFGVLHFLRWIRSFSPRSPQIWDVTWRNIAQVYRRFGGMSCHRFQGRRVSHEINQQDARTLYIASFSIYPARNREQELFPMGYKIGF